MPARYECPRRVHVPSAQLLQVRKEPHERLRLNPTLPVTTPDITLLTASSWQSFNSQDCHKENLNRYLCAPVKIESHCLRFALSRS